MSVSDFEEKYERALTELREVKTLVNWKLFEMTNKPLELLNKTFRLRPIYYAHYWEMASRSAVFFFFLSAAISAAMLNDKSQLWEADFWYARIVGSFVYGALIPIAFAGQAKKWKLSRWENL